ncbi:unnamed protein product [Boreogadus saida]
MSLLLIRQSLPNGRPDSSQRDDVIATSPPCGRQVNCEDEARAVRINIGTCCSLPSLIRERSLPQTAGCGLGTETPSQDVRT